MPELPEVETVRSDVSRSYAGETLESLVVTGRRTVRRHPADFLARVEGRVLVGVGRHGKYLLFEWDDGQVLVAHLRMSGQLLACEAGRPVEAHTHAVFSFGPAGELRFVDPRTFGELFLAEVKPGRPLREPAATPKHGAVASAGVSVDGGAAVDGLVELGHLGPDALGAEPSHLRAALANRRAPLKSLLVDQRVLAGIGNIYADEICFAAGLRPDRPGGALGRPQVDRLAASVRSVLTAAIVARGSTLGDQQYRDLYGQVGGYQLQHRVYGRTGLPCLTCRSPVQRVHFGAKSAYLCPKCQR